MTRSMPRLTKHIGWCAVSLIAIRLSVAAGSGYLPVIGPKPLHFQTPADLVGEKVVLPPLVMREEEPATLKENEPQAAVAPSPPPVPLAVKTELAQAPVTNEIPPSSGTDTNILTPQMLLRFSVRIPPARTGQDLLFSCRLVLHLPRRRRFHPAAQPIPSLLNRGADQHL